MKETKRAISPGTRTGAPRHQSGRAALDKDESEGYDWGVDLAGTIKLGGLKFVLGNRAALKVRSPLRFS